MKIVVDIDNTLVDYRKSIENSVKKRKFNLGVSDNFFELDVNTIKLKIKNNLGDSSWQYIQGDIYSDYGENIIFYKNSLKAIKKFIDRGHYIYLLSHKTKFGIKDSKEINILEIAQLRIFDWVIKNDLQKGIMGIIFCDTFSEKINFINTINPKILIDDLEEIHKTSLIDRKNDKSIKKFLFSGNDLNIENCNEYRLKGNLFEVKNWNTLLKLVI